MRTLFTLVLATIAFISHSQTPTIEAIANNKNGSLDGWNNPANWTPARVPTDGDVVKIPSGLTLAVKGSVNPGSLTILVYGTLAFDPSGKLDLSATSTIQVFSGGQITSSGSNSEVIHIGTELKYKGGVDPNPLSGPAFASLATGESPSAGFSVGVLPIKLRSFTAQPQGNRIALNWATDEELNTSHFVIERSTNARNWSAIQNVAAKGEAAGYTTTDATPAAGENFYRLKSVDIDGKFEYSHVLKVVRGRSLAVHVSPNPATEQVTVSLATPSTAPLQLQLVNNNGQVVSEKLYASGTSLIQFDLKSAAPGVYTLLLRNGNTLMETTQLLIK